MLNIYKCQYEYIENDTIVIHNIYTITFNNMFANLTLSQIVDIPVPIVNQSVNIIPSAPIAEDPN